VWGCCLREALIKAGLVDLQFKTSESKAKIANHSIAMGKIFNAGIAFFGCKGANHALISASLTCRNDFPLFDTENIQLFLSHTVMIEAHMAGHGREPFRIL